MKQVYLLQSLSNPKRFYTGVSSDAWKRLKDHNQGKAAYTRRFKPWKLKVVMSFEDDKVAYRFEKYLKSGSGRAFVCRHFGEG